MVIDENVKAMELEKKINEHTEKVKARPLKPKKAVCPYCAEQSITFYLHEKRKRQFLIILGNLVKQIMSLLIRWKCSNCKQSWTEYPFFCERYKRYVNESIIRLGDEYLIEQTENGKEKNTYRKVAKGKSSSRGYVTENGEIIERRLGHSTVWRSVGLIGTMPEYLQRVVNKIKEKFPHTSIHRKIEKAPVEKYRSEKRRLTIETGLRLLASLGEYYKIYETVFSPVFET